MKNTTREESTTTKPLGMKWYKFLIYFALFAGAFVNFIYGINYISGGIYVVETNGLITADTVYELYGVGLQVVDILYGLFLLALAVFCLVLRNQLAKYKPDAPHFVRIFYSILAGAPFLYSIIVALITSQSLGIEAMLSLIVGLIFTLWNVEYFKKRAHLFTDNPTITQEDAPAPSQMQNDVPVTPSATVTEESPEESNVATENNPPQEGKAIQSENTPTKAKRYCSLCGGEIDADTKQCTKCGKQYFKGFTNKKIALIVVSAVLLVSIISLVSIFVGGKDRGFKEVASVTYTTVDGKTKTESSTAFMSLGGAESISEEEYESANPEYQVTHPTIEITLSGLSRTPSSIIGFSNSDKGKYIYYKYIAWGNIGFKKVRGKDYDYGFVKHKITSEIQYTYIKVKVVDDDTIIIRNSQGETTYNVSSYSITYFKK